MLQRFLENVEIAVINSMTTAYLAIQMQMPLVNIMEHRFRLGISTIREHSSVDNFLSKMVKLKKTLNCKEQAALG